MNVNIKIDDLIKASKRQHTEYLIDSVRQLVDYCRGLEKESKGSGLKALKELASDSMDKKSYASVYMAIEDFDKPYKIIVI